MGDAAADRPMFGRVRVTAARRVDEPDLANPEVVRFIVDDATRVAREEQRLRRRRTV